jgi:hypothetical protein
MAARLCIEDVAADTYDKFMGGTVKTPGLDTICQLPSPATCVLELLSPSSFHGALEEARCMCLHTRVIIINDYYVLVTSGPVQGLVVT